jgi:hypothetical protein
MYFLHISYICHGTNLERPYVPNCRIGCPCRDVASTKMATSMAVPMLAIRKAGDNMAMVVLCVESFVFFVGHIKPVGAVQEVFAPGNPVVECKCYPYCSSLRLRR